MNLNFNTLANSLRMMGSYMTLDWMNFIKAHAIQLLYSNSFHPNFIFLRSLTSSTSMWSNWITFQVFRNEIYLQKPQILHDLYGLTLMDFGFILDCCIDEESFQFQWNYSLNLKQYIHWDEKRIIYIYIYIHTHT
jgi:hypothetical protein